MDKPSHVPLFGEKDFLAKKSGLENFNVGDENKQKIREYLMAFRVWHDFPKTDKENLINLLETWNSIKGFVEEIDAGDGTDKEIKSLFDENSQLLNGVVNQGLNDGSLKRLEEIGNEFFKLIQWKKLLKKGKGEK